MMQVLLVLVANLTGRHPDYSQHNVNMIIADVMAVTFFLFCILTPQIWAKVVCYIFAALGFAYLYYLAYKVCERSQALLSFTEGEVTGQSSTHQRGSQVVTSH